MPDQSAPPHPTHAPTPTPPAAHRHRSVVDVVLCAGQSNMVGFGLADDLPGVLLAPHPGVRVWQHDQLRPLAPGLHPANDEDGFGPELALGHTLAARTDRPLLLIKAARNGTSLARDWAAPSQSPAATDPSPQPGPQPGPMLRDLIAQTHAALDKLKQRGVNAQLRGLIWYQGETDAMTAANAHAYRDRLASMLDTIRLELDAPALPATLVRVHCSGTEVVDADAVRHAITAVADADPHAAWVDVDDLPLTDGYHLDSQGLLAVGDRCAEALLAIPVPQAVVTQSAPPAPPARVEPQVTSNEPATPAIDTALEERQQPEPALPAEAPPTPPAPDPTPSPISDQPPAIDSDANPSPLPADPSPLPPVPEPQPKPRRTPPKRRLDTPRIVAMINQKGGVGKTTTTVNLGAALARLGYRVLLVDLDPQAHLTLSCGIDPAEADVTVYDLLTDDDARAFSAVREVRDNLAVLPADVSLAGAEAELAAQVVTGRAQIKLRTCCENLLPAFDFVLLDCPPALGLLTINGLTMAKEVIVPMQAHYLALQGFGKLMETVGILRQGINPKLKVSGVVLCMYEGNTLLAGEVVGDVEQFLESARGTDAPWADAVVYQPAIRRNIKLAEAPSFGQSVFEYAPDSNGSNDYAKLAAHVAGLDPAVADSVL